MPPRGRLGEIPRRCPAFPVRLTRIRCFASRNSGRNASLSRGCARPMGVGGSNRASNSLHFPRKSGKLFRGRRVATCPPTPPTSLRARRVSARTWARAEKSRDSAGSWLRAVALANRRPRDPRQNEAAGCVRLCWQFGRFGFAPHRIEVSHFFFDGVHLDTKVLQVQANFALAALPVPEPSRAALLLAAAG